jgi:ribosomal protein S8
MTTWEVRNALRKNVLGVIEWENTKKYNDLLAVLKQANYIQDENKIQIFVESYGLAFSLIDRITGSEVAYVKLKID